MSQFMLLIRNEGQAMHGLSEAEVNQHMNKWGAWMGDLQQAGKLEGGLPFSATNAAFISNGGTEVTGGYYQTDRGVNVGGYLQIQAENLEEAIELAKGCPAFENPTSSVEVRECVNM